MTMIPWSTRILIILSCGLLLWTLQGCGSTDEDDNLIAEQKPAEELYNAGQEAFDKKDYSGAVESFEEVERQHPYSEWATRAQIMAAFSAYKAQEYDEAELIIDRFVKLHPNHERAPYAYYLKALGYYEQISDVGRDQKMTVNARQALREVVNRFPNTDYARDAKLKLDLTEDHLAGKEMEIGRYYLKRQEYLAAVNRFQHVIAEYQHTSHTPEALHRLVEVHLLLGLPEEAKRYASVLGYNYPGSKWYQYSYNLLEGKVEPATPEEAKSFFENLF